MKILTKNWGLKLLSLVLAIAIYHALKTSTYTFERNNDRPESQQR